MTRKEYKQIIDLLQGKTPASVVKNVCGELLGQGQFRDVYVMKNFPKYVIKIERDPSRGTFANVTEWRNYINNKSWVFLGDWLAPCELINETGSVLVQQRIYHKRRKDYPRYIPAMFTDLKLKNFGWIGDKFVCCDYAYMPVCVVNKSTFKPMKYAKWRGTLR